MPYIKKASIKQEIGGGAHLIYVLELTFDNGVVISTATSGLMPNALGANLVELDIPELQGLNADDELVAGIEDIDFEISKTIKNFYFTLSISLLKARALFEKNDLYRVIGETIDNDSFRIPTPIVTYFYGALNGDTDLDFDEYMIVPLLANKNSVKSKLSTFVDIWQQMSKILIKNGYESAVGRAGGFSADIASSVSVFSLLEAAALNSGWSFGVDCGLAMAVGGHHLYNQKTNKYHFGADHPLSGVDLLSVFNDWVYKHHLVHLEDASDFRDRDSAEKIYAEMGNKVVLSANRYLAGDELLLRKILSKKMYNAVCLPISAFEKISQFNDFFRVAAKHNLATVLVNDGDTSADAWMADLAVAYGFDFVRFGSVVGMERAAKYNRLVQIEDNLATY